MKTITSCKIKNNRAEGETMEMVNERNNFFLMVLAILFPPHSHLLVPPPLTYQQHCTYTAKEFFPYPLLPPSLETRFGVN